MRIKVILYLFFLCVVLSGCHILPYEGKGFGQKYTNQKPDDGISKAIKKAVGKKVYYQGKEEGTYKCYEYIIKDYDDEDLLVKIVDAAQTAIDNSQQKEKFIEIAFYETSYRGMELVASISNYYKTFDDFSPYDGFKHLIIYGTEYSDRNNDSRYNDAVTYIQLEDIRDLECSVKVEQSALVQNIVWEDVWQNLEKCTFIVPNGRIVESDKMAEVIDEAVGQVSYFGMNVLEDEPNWRGYNYMVSPYVDRNVLFKMVEAAQNELDHSQEEPYFIKLSLFEQYEKGVKPIAIIYNYYETDDGKVLYDGFKRLEIYGSDYLNQKWVDKYYNNVAAYTELEDIRSLKYSRKIEESDWNQEIVWKDVWENLEEYEVMEK